MLIPAQRQRICSRPALVGVLLLSGGDRREQILTALSAAAGAACLATAAAASIDSKPEAAIQPAENRSVTEERVTEERVTEESRIGRVERIALAVTQAPLTRFLVSASICWMAFASYEINRDMQVFTKPAKAIEDQYNAAQKRVNKAVRKARKEGAPVAVSVGRQAAEQGKPVAVRAAKSALNVSVAARKAVVQNAPHAKAAAAKAVKVGAAAVGWTHAEARAAAAWAQEETKTAFTERAKERAKRAAERRASKPPPPRCWRR